MKDGNAQWIEVQLYEYAVYGLRYLVEFLSTLGGILNLWKRHWCILRDETLMWFRGKLVMPTLLAFSYSLRMLYFTVTSGCG